MFHGQGQRPAAALLLSLPRQQRLSRLRHRLPQVERGDAGVRHQPEHRRHHGRDDPVPGGMIVPPRSGCRGWRDLAKRWGALLILDECQLAPARTGKMWAMEHYGVTPDIVTFGKGPVGGTRPSAAPSRRRRSPSRCAATPACHGPAPIRAIRSPAAVALKQLDIVLRDKLDERAERLRRTRRDGAAVAQEQVWLHRRRAWHGPLSHARHRQGSEDQGAGSDHGGTHPPQLRAGGVSSASP